MAARYLFEHGTGQPHAYFDGENVFEAATGKPLYYQNENYLYEHGSGKAVAYQEGKYFFDAVTSQPKWSLEER
jgi:hypothetical protein